MPELPEIEVLKNEIINYGLIGRRIIKINVNDKRAINIETSLFKEAIIGKRLEDVERKGKNLIFNLGEGFIIIHLRLFGQIRLLKERQKSSQIDFCFDNNKWLCLSKLAFGAGAHFYKDLKVLKLGEDALTIGFPNFKKLIKKGRIKPLLMDQKIIAGIGNTYADEMLFSSKINPTRLASSLKDDEISALYKAMNDVLDEAIKKGGVFDDFIHLNGLKGGFVCKVHNQEGKPCVSCGEIIKKIKIQNRGAFFCPNCQA